MTRAWLVIALLAAGTARADPGTLTRDDFRRRVLAANPDLAAAEDALAAADAWTRVAGAWPGPMLGLQTTPIALAPGGMAPGVSASLSQALPVAGQRDAARAGAEARALGMVATRDAARLDLGLAADLAWDAWYGVHVSLEIDARHASLLDDMEAGATAACAAGRAGADLPLAAALARARLDQELALLEAERVALQADMDRLLHRDPGQALPGPAPPTSTEPPASAGDHPTLRVAEAAVEAAGAEVEAARAARWPRVGLMASYSSMWDAPEHRLMAGVEVGLPAGRGARDAAVDAAQAEASRAGHVMEARQDAVAADLAVAQARLAGARGALDLQRERILPLAEQRLAVLQAGLAAGTRDLGPVIEAERDLLEAELEVATAEVRALDAEAALAHARGVGLPNAEAR